MDNYQLQQAANRFEKFVDDLTNWYVRRSRRRFWRSQNDGDKLEAYQTLHYVLITFCKTAAPFIPFITETIYQNLRTEEMPLSVHLCDYPIAESQRDTDLEEQMEYVMKAVGLGRFLRSQQTIRLRQPLSEVIMVSHNPKVRSYLSAMSEVIGEELNVKSVKIDSNEEELVHISAKANFKLLGKTLGAHMKEVANLIEKFTPAQIQTLRDGQALEILYSAGEAKITLDDILVQRIERSGMIVANEGEVIVALNTVIDEALELEGLAREVINKVQTLRKERGLSVTDRIHMRYEADNKTVQAITRFNDYIANETLCETISATTLSITPLELTGNTSIKLDLVLAN